jgi:hypothetical protein
LRVFISIFDRDTSEEDLQLQNTLLEIVARSLRFPPAVRAIHDLVKQRVPSPEDRSALSQSLIEYYKTIRDPTRGFELQFPYLTFGHLYAQVKSSPTSTSLANLEAIATQEIVCRITKKNMDRASVFEIDDDTILMDPRIVPLYRDGPLRKTVFNNIPDESESIATRLSVYSGGRFEEITYFASPRFDSRPAANVTASRVNNADKDPFALVAPSDLSSVDAPALTRDAIGTICVYLETTLCEGYTIFILKVTIEPSFSIR